MKHEHAVRGNGKGTAKIAILGIPIPITTRNGHHWDEHSTRVDFPLIPFIVPEVCDLKISDLFEYHENNVAGVHEAIERLFL
ncbi:hypothetical protein M0804_009135 [Polistes exclamans]|nr:hypothetical protein M0804_009135 [Polistes exclamans]